MFQVLLAVWILHTSALMSPGTNTFLVAQLAASSVDHKTTASAVAGIVLGACLWIVLAIAGIGTLFHAAPSLKLFVQIAGGSYLLYVASRLWRSGHARDANRLEISPMDAFKLGLFTNVTNPKSGLFFSSAFAALLPVNAGWALTAATAILLVFNGAAWHSGLAYLFSRKRVREWYTDVSPIASKIAGALVGLLGASVLVSALATSRSL
ncbi:LysE family transporter [Thiomonas bhubaneswarensis]|uniref:Threonine/homoserine/homoserine lactone efflux protein n=1 Tax=Thiomonas bhubaneswarensis TaxID=339866 RepID=A0A0K6HZT5_9BURK|nr:LysE family transporter [Thiomonas bhubaneswarensis]CUA96547.1 Threonine/homoserine/homoserine lactone efflux protein [Thiomonas bhubaneswarensis]